MEMNMKNNGVLEVKNVSKYYSAGGKKFLGFSNGKKAISALDKVSFNVFNRETIVFLGESGSGKTTIARIITGLENADNGKIVFNEKVLSAKNRKKLRGRIQMVFQDAASSLDPFYTVLKVVGEPLGQGKSFSSEQKNEIKEALENVGLDSTYLNRRVNTLSGGQKQRVSIARAIVSRPEIIVLDEATTSLDVSIQAQVLNILVDLQDKFGFTYLFITHDFNVARFMADRIYIIYSGRIVESGRSKTVLENPKHPYSILLRDASPQIGKKYDLINVADPDELPTYARESGKYCRFVTRCSHRMEICYKDDPHSVEVDGGEVSCFLYGISKE